MVEFLELRNSLQNVLSFGDGVSTDFVLDYVDWGTLNVNFETYKLPFVIGNKISAVDVQQLEPSIYGYVISDYVESFLGMNWEDYYKKQQESINRKKQALNRFVNVFEDLDLVIGDYKMRCRPSNPVAYGVEFAENNQVLCRFKLSLYAYDGLFVRDAYEVKDFSYVVGGFHFPLVLKEHGNVFGIVQRKQVHEVENRGDVEVGCIIKVRADGGAVKNPRVYNVLTNAYIQVNRTLNDGEELIINTEQGEEAIDLYVNNVKQSVLADIDVGSTFLQVPKGTSFFGYSVASGSAFLVMSMQFKEKMFRLDEM